MAGCGQQGDQFMSYILDALKKLEHEKSQKFRKDGIAGLAGVLFENERPKPARSVAWKIALAVTVAVLVTFGVTWHYLQSGKVHGNVLSQRATTDLHAPPAPLAPPVKVEAAPVPPAPLVVPPQNTPAPVQAKQRPATPSPVQPPIPQIAIQAVAPVIADVVRALGADRVRAVIPVLREMRIRLEGEG